MSALPSHLFVSSTDGALYDTRPAGWSALPPLRPVYSRHVRQLDAAADVKAALRAGAYAWPGGYPLYFITNDGEALSFDAVRAELRQVLAAMADTRDRSGWRVVAVDVNYEDSDLICAHTGETIPPAYGDDGEG